MLTINAPATHITTQLLKKGVSDDGNAIYALMPGTEDAWPMASQTPTSSGTKCGGKTRSSSRKVGRIRVQSPPGMAIVERLAEGDVVCSRLCRGRNSLRHCWESNPLQADKSPLQVVSLMGSSSALVLPFLPPLALMKCPLLMLKELAFEYSLSRVPHFIAKSAFTMFGLLKGF